MNPPVFYGAAILILLFAAVVIGFPQRAGEWLLAAQTWASQTVGWYYLLAMTLYLIFVVVTALSGYGKIKLGADHDEPEFSYLSWAGMLFAAGISITLFFFCVSEPLTHFLQPPQGEAGTQEAARQAMELLFLHWGLHGWGVFALVAMALAYFAYRHNLPLALRSALYPLIGKRINGPIGYTVDCFGIIATVFGLGADMGFGVLQLNSGLDYLYAIPHTHPVQMALIVLMMGAAISVAVSGVDKGIRILSDINMLLACSLLQFVLFAGPTQHLLNTLVQNVGDYLGHLPGKSFDLYAYGGPSDWLARGRCSTGPGGSPGRPSSACSSRASRAAGRSANSSSACCSSRSASPWRGCRSSATAPWSRPSAAPANSAGWPSSSRRWPSTRCFRTTPGAAR